MITLSVVTRSFPRSKSCKLQVAPQKSCCIRTFQKIMLSLHSDMQVNFGSLSRRRHRSGGRYTCLVRDLGYITVGAGGAGGFKKMCDCSL